MDKRSFIDYFYFISLNDCFRLSGKKYEDICPSTHNMDVPHVKREDYQLTDISDDGYLSLMSDNGDLREDLKIPDGEVGIQLRAEYDAGKDILCTVLKSCGEEVRHIYYFSSSLSGSIRIFMFYFKNPQFHLRILIFLEFFVFFSFDEM